MEKASSEPLRSATKDPAGLHPPPAGWKDIEETLASASGLSVLLVAGHQPPELSVSNNNSICKAFQSSEEHAHLCDPYCGQAHARATQQGVTSYRCHAGLSCFAIPVELETKRSLAIIGGRAFLTTTDYTSLAERFRVGDLRSLLSADLFKNVIFAAGEDLKALQSSIQRAAKSYSERLKQNGGAWAKNDPKAGANGAGGPEAGSTANLSSNSSERAGEPIEATLQSVATTYHINSLSLLICDGASFTQAFATGRFIASPAHLELEGDSALLETLKKNKSIVLREGALGFGPAASASSRGSEGRHLELFPLLTGDEVKGGLLIADTNVNGEVRLAITALCRDLSLPMEVSRLRRQLERRERDATRLQNFAERINVLEPSEPYLSILRCSTDLLSAERGSLMLFDEASNELELKASIGLRAEVTRDTRIGLQDTVCGTVFREGRALVVRDVNAPGQKPAPAERRYKTDSFISYPISVGGRRVGILNVTDKTGGAPYGASDLSLLDSIAPQMALALDRVEWREKAVQFQLMSVTDPLTGMLNRRYLEERLTEELNRSRRHIFDMSFMMIDIDDFKLYNDRNGHQAGDMALEMAAQCLKSVLRSADVASRYGGEEFCILLPQTPLLEAKIIAERIRRRVELTHFPNCEMQPLGAVTVSIGLSIFDSTVQTPWAIIRAADRALYAAKHKGKNRVEFLQDDRSRNPLLHVPEESETAG